MIENEEAGRNSCIENGQEWNNLQMNDNRLWFGSRAQSAPFQADDSVSTDSDSVAECSESAILMIKFQPGASRWSFSGSKLFMNSAVLSQYTASGTRLPWSPVKADFA